jgi:HSP20 family protein
MKSQRKEDGAMTTTYLERILDPWNEFNRLSRTFNRTARCETCEFPAVNVWVNGEEAVINSEIPGINREAIDISVSGDTVTLRGSRPEEEKKEGASWHRHELWHGDFKKTVQLPFNIDADKVKATYRNGILHVTFPQLESDKPKKIKITSD